MILNCLWYQIICIFIFGLIIGSFLNVISLRTLLGENIIYPPSKCPYCGKKLLWWHNIPLLSFVLLKGKCFFCKKQISIQYPIVELLNAALYCFLWLKTDNFLHWMLADIVVSLFLVLSVMDIKSKTISLKYALLLIITAILFNYNNVFNSILGCVVVFACCYILQKSAYNAFNKEVLGNGDLYLLAALGALSGIKMAPLFIFVAFIFQALLYFPKFLQKIIQERDILEVAEFIWFALMYTLLFLAKVSVISLNFHAKIVIFINLFVSLCLICKFLFCRIRNLKTMTTRPFCPTIFITVILYFLFV